jgi:hypothetical protein
VTSCPLAGDATYVTVPSWVEAGGEQRRVTGGQCVLEGSEDLLGVIIHRVLERLRVI